MLRHSLTGYWRGDGTESRGTGRIFGAPALFGVLNEPVDILQNTFSDRMHSYGHGVSFLLSAPQFLDRTWSGPAGGGALLRDLQTIQNKEIREGRAATRGGAFDPPPGYTRLPRSFTDAGPSYPRLTPTTTATVTVDTTVSLGSVSPYNFGSNMPLYNARSWVNNKGHQISEKVKAAGVQFLRFPGGNPANGYLWDKSYDQHPFFKQHCDRWGGSWELQVADFVALCRATGAEPLIQLNAAIALVESVDNATALARGWLRSFRDQMNFTVRHVEFGNENYGKWEVPFPQMPSVVSGSSYGNAFVGVVEALRDEFPDLQFGLVSPFNDKGGDAVPNFMEDMFSKTRALQVADWVSLHYYFYKAKGAAPSNADLLAAARTLPALTASWVQNATSFSGNATLVASTPLALTEFALAMDASAGGCALVEHVNALFLTEMIGGVITSPHFGGLANFAFANGYKSGDGCAHGADYGMVSKGNTHTPDGTLYSGYSAFALFDRVFGTTAVKATSGLASLRVFASTFDDGTLGIVLVNESPAVVSVTVEIHPDTAGAAVQTVANVYAIEGDGLAAATSKWNGVSGTIAGGPWDSAKGLAAFPPFHATLEVTGGAVEIAVPPTSVVGVVLKL